MPPWRAEYQSDFNRNPQCVASHFAIRLLAVPKTLPR